MTDALLTARERRTIARLRLAAQLVSTRDDGIRSPADVVRHLGAMQAQDFPAAKWAVGLRLPGSTERDIERSLSEGSIVRSWPMRGTLHFVAPEDLRWMLALTSPRLISKGSSRLRELGLDDATLERAREAAIAALRGGGALSRAGMHEVFASVDISPTEQRGYQLLWYLAQTGTLCLGPLEGKQQLFVLLDEWAPPAGPPDRDEALGMFARRYFTGHGPATVRDFAWWSSLTLADARRGLDLAAPSLERIDFAGVPHYLSQAVAASGAEARRAGISALPAFDEFVIGYAERSASLPLEHRSLVLPTKNGVFLPTIARDGFIEATWRRTTTAREVSVAYAPFPGRSTAGFATAARAYARFLALTLRADA